MGTGNPVGFLEAIADVIPLCFHGVITEHREHVECDTLFKRVPCLAPGGIMNYAPQVLPWTGIDQLSQDLAPRLPCLFQEEVGVVLEDWLAMCSTTLFAFA